MTPIRIAIHTDNIAIPAIAPGVKLGCKGSIDWPICLEYLAIFDGERRLGSSP